MNASQNKRSDKFISTTYFLNYINIYLISPYKHIYHSFNTDTILIIMFGKLLYFLDLIIIFMTLSILEIKSSTYCNILILLFISLAMADILFIEDARKQFQDA